MFVREKLYTLDEFWEFINLPENADKRYELIRGVIYEMPTPSPLHAWIASTIARLLGNFVAQFDLGFVFGDNCSFVLSNGDELIPDASFVAKYKLTFPLPKQFLFAPDLAVEVVSPSNKPRDMLNKIESYLAGGTRIVWAVYPDELVVDVYQFADNGRLMIEKFDIDATLNGGDVLPGFTLAVRDVFPKEPASGM